MPCPAPPLDVDELNPLLDPIEPDPIDVLVEVDVLVEEFTDSHPSTLFDFPIGALSESGGLPPDFSFSDSTSTTPIDREDLQSVPEPGTLATLGVGLLAITWMVRRRQPIRLKLRPDR